jgi:hypothetical protein
MQKIIPYVASVIIAAGAFAIGAVTNIGDAFAIALSKEKAIEYCGKIINSGE